MGLGAVIFAANRGYALTRSRRGLILRLLEQGREVVLATARDSDSLSLCEMGAHHEPVTIERGGPAPSSDIRAYWQFRRIYARWQPTLIQHFHAKPVILGTLAARGVLGDSVRVVNTITGLGQGFVRGRSMARLAAAGYSAALGRSDLGVFQNAADRDMFVGRKWLSEERARCVAGSGVDLEAFTEVDRSGRGAAPPVVVMIARLLRDKGVPEFVAVAERVRRQRPEARFVLAGEEDAGHARAVSRAWLDQQPGVEYVGRLADVRPLLAEADLMLFPSYYREGMPRVVVEAAATGLPTVGFRTPGVDEAVEDGDTGLLVEPHDVAGLGSAVEHLLDDPGHRRALGKAARRKAEREFDVRVIEHQYLAMYRELWAAPR